MPKVRRTSMVEQLTAELLAEIRSNKYPVGSLLPTEPFLGEQFGVSRTVLREAISQLRADGIVETVQGRGTYVSAKQRPARIALSMAEGDISNLLRIVELRRGLEGEAAMLAATRREQSDIDAMTASLERMEVASVALDADEIIAGDIAFHRAIFVAARNDYLLEIYNHVMNLVEENILKARRKSLASGRGVGPARSEHLKIFNAISEQSPEQALLSARQHMDSTASRLSSSLTVANTAHSSDD